MKRLPVPFIGQGQDLPTGCESVSAAMALQYLGFSVTAEEFAREWLPGAGFTGTRTASATAGPPPGLCGGPPRPGGPGLLGQRGTDRIVPVSGG